MRVLREGLIKFTTLYRQETRVVIPTSLVSFFGNVLVPFLFFSYDYFAHYKLRKRIHMNRITELLDLEDSDIFISDISIQGTTKFLTLETKLYAHHCPSCGFKMHSRGIKKRIVKHPILQDNYELVLILKQRRWRCTNPECRYDIINRNTFCVRTSCCRIFCVFLESYTFSIFKIFCKCHRTIFCHIKNFYPAAPDLHPD